MGSKPEDIFSIDLSKYSIDELSTIDTSAIDNMSHNTYTYYTTSTGPTTITLPNTVHSTVWTATTPAIDYNADNIIWDWKSDAELVEFDTHFPPMEKIKEMCDVYPGLKKAFDHFKTIYDLTKDDFERRKEQDE